MLYLLALDERPDYLHARVTGERTSQNFLRYLEEAFAACIAAGLRKVLLEMHLSGPSLSSVCIVNIISLTLPEALKLTKVAFVEAAGGDPAMALAETAALNRGVNARFFNAVGEAASWLSDAPAGR